MIHTRHWEKLVLIVINQGHWFNDISITMIFDDFYYYKITSEKDTRRALAVTTTWSPLSSVSTNIQFLSKSPVTLSCMFA